jgi:hypothetical protein
MAQTGRFARAHATSALRGRSNPHRLSNFARAYAAVPLPLTGHENQRRQDRLRFLEAHVDFSAEPAVPAEGCSRVALRRLVAQQDAELARASPRPTCWSSEAVERFGDVAAIERSAKAHER